MSGIELTKELKRQFVPIGLLEPNPLNPNTMREREFNLLYDNIENMGITDPILIRPHPNKGDMYRIIGGEHRWEVAKLLGFEEVPCTIVDNAEFSEDQEKFQMVRHNIIHGKMSPQKFMKLYESITGKYAEEIIAESFGFGDEEEFNRLVAKTAKSLPSEMQEEFQAAAKEVRTIEGLSAILNKMFSDYGDTLPYGYMVVAFGNQESIWLRMLPKMRKNFMEAAGLCKEHGKTLDHFMDGLLQLIADDKLDSFDMEQFMAELPDVVLVDEVEIPTLDFVGEL